MKLDFEITLDGGIFTFHYGLIQIKLIEDYDLKEEFFTFHYGLIQIQKNLTTMWKHPTLHSIMVLFKFI